MNFCCFFFKPERVKGEKNMAKSFLDNKFASIQIKYWIIIALVALVAVYAYSEGWFEKTQTITPDGTDGKLKLDKELKQMTVGSTVAADGTANYNAESGAIAVQIDAEKTNNSTHTTFIIKAADVDGNAKTVATVTQAGLLSTPTEPVTVTVTAEIDMNYISGFTNTNEILSSSVTASAPTMKTAAGEVYYPVVLKNEKPAVYVNDVLGGKNLSWTVSNTSQTVLVTFDLDWAGIDKMTSISDEIQVPIKFTNTDNPATIQIRAIKNAAL